MAEQMTDSMIARAEMLPAQRSNRRLLIIAAWAAVLLLSKLPLVVAREFLGADIPWITAGWIGVALLLVAMTFVWHALKPLRSFFVTMLVILVLTTVFDRLVVQSVIWERLVAGRSPLAVLFAERALIAVEALVVLGAVLLMGYRRRDVFLAVGDLNAPVAGVRLPGRARPVGWLAFGAIMTLLLGGLFLAFMVSQSPTGLAGFAVPLLALPLILGSAALNAFGEEAMYRAAPLATLLPAVGPGHALAMTALWFGLGHFYGSIPSGVFGLVQAGLLALLLGKAMLDTRGMGWSWFIHVVLDTIIYVSLAAAATG